MKKVILSMLVAGSLLATSCKKEKKADAGTTTTEEVAKEVKEGAKKTVEATKEVANDVVKTVESAIAGVSIPEFKDPKVGEYLKSYADYAKEYIDAKGNVLKNGLGEKGAKLAAEGKTILSNLDAEAVKKYNTFMSAVNTKMHEATK